MTFFGPDIRNGLPIGLGSTAGFKARAFTPSVLFAQGEQGAWYDPTDIPVNWRRNLLTYTEQFDNAAWTKAQSSISANAETAPDGTLTADKLIEAATNDIHRLEQNVTIVNNAVYTISVYAKAAERNWIAVYEDSGGGNYAFFNVSTGVVGTVANGTATISAAANGFYRCTFTFTQTIGTTGRFRIAVSSANTTFTYTGNGTSGIFIWGAQLEQASTATDYQQIVTPEISFLTYDPQPVMYTDSAGTTPVTAVEQAVGLILDKSKGLVIGSDLVTNGGPFTATTGWTTTDSTLAISGDQLEVTNSAAAAGFAISASFSTVAGRMYRVRYSARRGTSSSIDVQAARGDTGNLLTAVTLTSTTLVSGEFVFFAASATSVVRLVNNQAVLGRTGYLAFISVRELAGNHAIQPTAASRPTLRARYNLLTYSEQFDNAAFNISSAVTFSGGIATFGAAGYRYQVATVGVVQNVTYTLRAKLSSPTGKAVIGLRMANNTTGADGTYQQVALTATPTVYSITRTFTNAGTAIDCGLDNRSPYGDGVAGDVVVTEWDLRRSNDTYLPYQRIAAATDYDTVGFPVYLAFDGSDDSLYTSSIDFSATDKMTVFAGVTKLSDGAAGTVVELSASSGGNAGAFGMFAPPSAAAAYSYRSTGTGTATAVTANSYAAPITNVLTGESSIATDICTLRVNGVSAASDATDQGTGNYGTYAMFIGRRNNTAAVIYNGRLAQLIVRGAQSSAALITQAERWIAGKQGRVI